MIVPKRVGYWLNDQKLKKLSLAKLEDAFRLRNIEAVNIDLSKDINSQGKFDGILHKLTYILAQADSGNEEDMKIMKTIELFQQDNPNVAFIDPIEKIRSLMNRFEMYSFLQNCDFDCSGKIFTPPFLVLKSNVQHKTDINKLLSLTQVNFPLVCKPLMANGVQSAHEMILIFNEASLSECIFPCVLQTFINHNATLYKLYCIGDKYFMVERPSIKNLFPSDSCPPIHFISGDISTASSRHQLTLQSTVRHPLQPPSAEILNIIAKTVHSKWGLGLFGVDVILEASTGRAAIIDVNAFPGYDGVTNFEHRIADFVVKELDKLELRRDYQNQCNNQSNLTEEFLSQNGANLDNNTKKSLQQNGQFFHQWINNDGSIITI